MRLTNSTDFSALRAPALPRRTIAAAGLLWLAGCGSLASPPARLYRLPGDPPTGVPATAAATQLQTWELANTLGLPEYVDREAIVVAEGNSLRVLQGSRWAEPLRDAVPRLLRNDLALLRGATRVWAAPAPPGVVVERQLRVDILALQADSARGTVELQARWWLVDPRGVDAPLGGQADLRAPAGPGADAIVSAHRDVLWQLAQRITLGQGTGSGR